jgi:uncharacterized membrane protein YgcG
MKVQKWLIIAVALCLLLASCSSGKSGTQESKPPQSPESSGGDGSGQSGGSKQEEKGEPHEYIKDATSVKIDQIETDKLDISRVVFLDEKRIAITCPKDIGEKKSFIFDLETKQSIKIPDNTSVIKKLDSGDLFVNTGSEGAYAILDGSSYTVKKAIVRPGTVDVSLDLSPDSKYLAYITNDGLFVSDPDFKNPLKLISSKRMQDEFQTEMPRYPLWIDNSRVSYKYLGWENVKYCGVIMRDGTNNTIFENSKDSTIYPLISGDYIYRGEYGRGVGVIDGISGEKKIISDAELEYEGFTFDKNGKWVAYFMKNKDITEQNKWTARLEIRGITTGEKIKEYKSEKPNTKPVESAVASPDGKFMLFTDLDKTGRRVLYKLEVKMQEKSQSGGSESSGSSGSSGSGSSGS